MAKKARARQRRKAEKRGAPLCPACQGPMKQEPGENSTSRFYRGIYICSGCGTKEATHGQFWRCTGVAEHIHRNNQQAWIASY